MKKVVFLRHGQSQWNLENRFTGWVDVDLSAQGVEEARQAGELLKAQGYRFDVAYTSVLKRAIRTLWLTLDAMDQMYLPVHTDWRLNERHYGALQGLDKKETAAKHGSEQVLRWRRGFAVQPPAMDNDDPQHPRFDPRYAALAKVPSTESLADTIARVRPWWDEVLAPALHAGAAPIVTAHGNSLRALVKFLDDVSEDDIIALNIPTGVPLVYEFDAALNPIKHYYLGDQDAIAAAAQAVANQTGG